MSARVMNWATDQILQIAGSAKSKLQTDCTGAAINLHCICFANRKPMR